MLVPFPQNGLWLLGGFAICRLPEFALGMALGMWHSQSPARLEKFLLGGPGLIIGLVLYPGALWLYHCLFAYVFCDFATGACALLVILGIAAEYPQFPGPAKVYRLGRSVLLWHLFGAPTLRHLARTSHPRTTHLDVLYHYDRHTHRHERLGNLSRKSD